MISSLECFRIGAKGYHIYFYSPLLLCEGPNINSPGSREPEMTARDQGAATFWGLYRKRVHALSASLRMEIKKSSVHLTIQLSLCVQRTSHSTPRDFLHPQQYHPRILRAWCCGRQGQTSFPLSVAIGVCVFSFLLLGEGTPPEFRMRRGLHDEI